MYQNNTNPLIKLINCYTKMPIQLLSENIATRIAAGEVIERPASVVKELVENSLDANSSEINIEVKTGGIESILVSDNGEGINKEEIKLAFQRFATSKLYSEIDLDSISTLGFRGEALPSIASVSDVSLITKTVSDLSGKGIKLSNGKILSIQDEGASQGTSITVRNLFKSFPARRKYLKSSSAEASRIQNVVTRYSLANPHIKMKLSLDNRITLSTSGSGKLRETISEIYGPQVGQIMLELQSETPITEKEELFSFGMISPVSLTRANRNYISIFVNGRWIQNRMLGYAIQEAYHGFLMEKRFPIAVLHISVNFENVDVNIHPSKEEVRFLQERHVFSELQKSIRYTLTNTSPIPNARKSQPANSSVINSFNQKYTSPFSNLSDQESLSSQIIHDKSHIPLKKLGSNEEQQPILPFKALPELRILGQIEKKYIASEGPNGLYLIDQHAAHERILFEKIKVSLLSQSMQTQGLIESVTVEFHPRQKEIFENNKKSISDLGFEVEVFGDETHIIRGIPSILANTNPTHSLLDILDLMAEGNNIDAFHERAAYSMACHSAIRAGKLLSHDEMSELITQLQACEQPHTCPHGRPTLVHMNSSWLEREFGRR